MSRLTLLHINIIGIVVALIVGAGLYFTLVTGAQDDQQKAQTAYNGVKARADKAMTAANALKKAKADKIAAERDYNIYEKVYMPVIGFGEFSGASARVVMMERLFWPNNGRSWPERFQRVIRNYMASEQKRNGIVWENPGVIALPPYGPNPNTIEAGATPGDKLGPILHYRYDMVVRGHSLPALMRHLRGWPQITGVGVPVYDNPNIVGNSPNLTMTYTLTLTIIEREDEVKKIPPEDLRVGGDNSGAGGRGGFGGGFGGGGMMGAPGMMQMGMRRGGMGGPGGVSGAPMGMSMGNGMSSGGGMGSGGGK